MLYSSLMTATSTMSLLFGLFAASASMSGTSADFRAAAAALAARQHRYAWWSLINDADYEDDESYGRGFRRGSWNRFSHGFGKRALEERVVADTSSTTPKSNGDITTLIPTHATYR